MGEAVVSDFYERLLAEHGDSPRALDWSEEGQRARFQVLAEVGIEERHSVLDVGCGLGHFLSFLRGGGNLGMYRGVDSCEAMIAALTRGDSTLLADFVVADALTADLPRADYAVSSGMLNIETSANEEQMATLLRKCFDACTIGCAVNMLSSRAQTKRDGRHYYDPAAWLQRAFEISPSVVLRHDYRPNDFTLYLYRERA